MRRARSKIKVSRFVLFCFLAPFFVPFIIFYVGPIGYAVLQSLQTTVRIGGVFGEEVSRFAGFTQYLAVIESPDFQAGVVRVLAFGVIQVPAMMVVALVLALLLDSPHSRFDRFFRLVYFMPIAVPGVIAALMWGALLDPATSPFDQAGMGVNFLGPELVFVSLGNLGIWAFAGANVVIILSALTAIPREVYEAARIDGASNLQIALAIKVPLVRPAIIFATMLNIIGTLQFFTEPMLFRTLTSHITSSFTPNMLAYGAATGHRYSFSAAVSVSLALVTFVASLGFLRFLQKGAQQ